MRSIRERPSRVRWNSPKRKKDDAEHAKRSRSKDSRESAIAFASSKSNREEGKKARKDD